MVIHATMGKVAKTTAKGVRSISLHNASVCGNKVLENQVVMVVPAYMTNPVLLTGFVLKWDVI